MELEYITNSNSRNIASNHLNLMHIKCNFGYFQNLINKEPHIELLLGYSNIAYKIKQVLVSTSLIKTNINSNLVDDRK